MMFGTKCSVRNIEYKFTLSMILVAATAFFVSCGGRTDIGERYGPRSPTPAAAPAERVITGVFNVDGAASGGNQPYTGVLNIANKGDVYEYRWSTTRGSRIGTGVQLGNAAAASFAPRGGGDGCGVILYRIAPDGSLEGRIARWGETKFAIENATRTKGTGFVGGYTVNGVSFEGEPYSGSLNVKKDGGGCEFEWKTGKTQFAFGTWQGSYAAASFGGRQCSFVVYDILSDGNLEGNWGGQSSVTFGTETAKRE